ncbi:MAG: hypothetical protein IQL11_00335 [Bacteroidales bacterium]|nr:hypothetical protein [Bacteroidales bacterium]
MPVLDLVKVTPVKSQSQLYFALGGQELKVRIMSFSYIIAFAVKYSGLEDGKKEGWLS